MTLHSLLRAFFTATLIVCLMTPQAYAQDVKVIIDEIEIDDVKSVGPGGGRSRNNILKEDWKEIEVEFTVESDGDSDLLEELSFQFFIAALDALNNDEEVTLIGESNFINVPVGGDQLVAMYLSPTALLRYGGEKMGASFFKKGGIKDFNIHVKALVRGREVGSKDFIISDFDENWYRQGKQVRDALVEAKDSPWWTANALLYNQYKPLNR
ncbi:MAG: Amuc_1102 family pilus-like protein [Verrucomicrobiota bacterium]